MPYLCPDWPAGNPTGAGKSNKHDYIRWSAFSEIDAAMDLIILVPPNAGYF